MDDGDFDAWLREFEACCAANGWKVTEANDKKIVKLPTFLHGRAASNFYAILAEDRSTYADPVASMRRALCPMAKRENFFAEFERRVLRPEEDPWCINGTWRIFFQKPILLPVLLTRQFSRGLPPLLKLKMLEHNSTPSLAKMIEFTQRFCALGRLTTAEIPPVQVDTVAPSST